MLLIGISAVVVAGAAFVTPQAFAGTLLGSGGGSAAGSRLPGLGGKAAGGKLPGLGGKSVGGKLPGLGGKAAGGKLPGLGGKAAGGKLPGLGGKAAGGGAGGVLDRLKKRGAKGAAGGATGAGQGGGACSDVQLVFARGTGEKQGLGIVGQPLAQALAAEMPDRSVDSFAVVYDAAANQASAGPGATNMTQHIEQVAQACPDTQFVIGGYSQGASVTDIALGIQNAGTAGDAIPADLQPRVAAVVVYGNPLGLRRQTIAQASPDNATKVTEFCNDGDPVCGNGGNFAAHLAYPRNGTVEQGAQFAAQQLGG